MLRKSTASDKPRQRLFRVSLAIAIALLSVGMGLKLFLPSVPQNRLIAKDKIQQGYKMALVKAGRVLGEWQIVRCRLPNHSCKSEQIAPKPAVKLRVALLSDSQGDNRLLGQVLGDIAQEQVDLVLHLGDLSAGGEREVFQEAKRLFEYYRSQGGYSAYAVLPGDHDFNWQPNYSLSNFSNVFGLLQVDRVISLNSVRFILWDNSRLDRGRTTLNVSRLKWLKKQLEGKETVFVLTHKTLYSPYFPNKVDPNGGDVLKLLGGSGTGATGLSRPVAQVFSGDTHMFARYKEPNSQIEITTVGAAGSYRNFLPMWVLLTVYQDNSFSVVPRPVTNLPPIREVGR